MAKLEQVLVIEPESEIKFKGPFTSMVTSYLKLTNPSESVVVFKIKTTAPKKYCVRPNSGTISPNDSVEVAVGLEPFQYNSNEKQKHKFMIQTMLAPQGDFSNETLWKEASAESVMETRLRCVFEAAEGEDEGALEEGLITTSKEVSALKERVSSYIQENVSLREQLSSVQTQLERFKHSPDKRMDKSSVQSFQHFTTTTIIITIAMMFLGFAVGKYVI